MKFFLSCEHGDNQIPKEYASLFKDAESLLASHRGWDPGALELFKTMHSENTFFSIYSEISRLLVDLNRSLHRRSLFSELTKGLSKKEKEQILNQFYYPFRNAFGQAAQKVVSNRDKIFHVSVHSFTPELNGVVRTADIGLLYHPAHNDEKQWAKRWKSELEKEFPHFRIRFNYPYLGKIDGYVANLRKRFGNSYSGIELEMNNKYANNQTVIDSIAKAYHRICI
ncbi:MAG TPA: N-formylglutamate amidohydrolase [Marinilabiliaceae bacterium]|nr:N-formylglutamate amidohydrolase [Marinilabiliaceae bacterium]